MPETTHPDFIRLIVGLGFTIPPARDDAYGRQNAYHQTYYNRVRPNQPELHIRCSSFTKNNLPARVRVHNDSRKAQFTIVGVKRVVNWLPRVVGAIDVLDNCGLSQV